MELLCYLIQGYLIVCVVRIIFSWLPDIQDSNAFLGAIHTFCYAITEPVFATVRKAMPRIGDLPIDFSPIVVFLGLSLLMGIVC